jgi:hypothetical protein
LTLPTGPDETFAALDARRRKLSLGLDAGAEEGAGAAAVALPAELSADFLDRYFFAEPVSAAFASAFSAVPADSLERLFFVVVEESAAAALSPASADFFDRLFLGVASASVDVAVASAESALLFFARLFFVLSAAELSAVELSAGSADFLDRFFFVVDLPLSAAVGTVG